MGFYLDTLFSLRLNHEAASFRWTCKLKSFDSFPGSNPEFLNDFGFAPFGVATAESSPLPIPVADSGG